MKKCPKCKENKSIALFNKDKSRKDGLKGYCKLCTAKYIAEYKKSWNLANPEKNRADPKKKNASTKTWKLANFDKITVSNKAWRLANSEKLAASSAKRRANKLKATPLWANTEFEQFAIQEMYALAKLRTKITDIEHHVDHIVPLKSDIVQGFHCLENLQILEAKLNIVKGNRLWPDMP